MNYKLPSLNIPLIVVADILVFLGMNENASLNQICKFVGRGTSYIRSGLDIAKMLGAVEKKDGSLVVDSEVRSWLGRTPSDDVKYLVIRKLIQQWEPFILFVRYCLNGSSSSEAARKVYVIYEFAGKDYKFLETLFINWGNTTKLITLLNDSISLSNELGEFGIGFRDEIDLNDDLAIRLDIVNRLGENTFAFLQHDEVAELVDAVKKSSLDSRSAIECAGRALEDFLRRIATKVLVDVSRANGIGQVVNSLYNYRPNGILDNKIHSKHFSIGSSLGDIRNMAGHGKEAKTMERWTLTSFSAQSYIEMVLATIRSIYVYVENGDFVF